MMAWSPYLIYTALLGTVLLLLPEGSAQLATARWIRIQVILPDLNYF